MYGTSSLSAVGEACHEAGHAPQHASGYAWLGFRNALVPVTQIGSYLSYVILMLGFLLQHPALIYLGIGLFFVAWCSRSSPCPWSGMPAPGPAA